MSELASDISHFFNYENAIYEEELNCGLERESPIVVSTASELEADKEMPVSLTDCIETTIENLKKCEITIPNEALVKSYLSEYSGIIDLVESICLDAVEAFGSISQLSLEVYSDPEIKDRYLALYIRQFNYDKNLYVNIKKFRSSYDSLFKDKEGYFLVTTDFQKPLS